MPYYVNPENLCTEDGCGRPRATGLEVCSQHSRLRGEEWSDPLDRIPGWPAEEDVKPDPGGICRALISASGKIIRLESRGAPFVQEDVDAAVRGIQAGRKARRAA